MAMSSKVFFINQHPSMPQTETRQLGSVLFAFFASSFFAPFRGSLFCRRKNAKTLRRRKALFLFFGDEVLLITLDNQLIFPLIQKAIINESILISFKKNDFTTIIEFVFCLFLFISDMYMFLSKNSET